MLDFASEMNRGDAIMQEVFYENCRNNLNAKEISVVSVYGPNQEFNSQEHFDLSYNYTNNILPNLRLSSNFLDGQQDKYRTLRKLLNMLRLFSAYVQVLILSIFGRFFFRSDQKKVLEAIDNSDYVIWNGRNFRNRKGIGEFYDILCMSISPLIAFARGKEVVIIGASIWPLRYTISKKWLAFVLSKCEFVSVRESFSQSYAINTLGLTNVRLDPDLSFSSMNISQDNFSESGRDDVMYITLVDWDEDGDQVQIEYLKFINGAVKWAVKNGTKVVFVPQVFFKWEDYRHLLDRLDIDSPLISVIEKNLSHKDLLGLYRKGKYLIATRMHSAIFALSQGCKVITVSYDSGAKWHILKDAGLKEEFMCEMQNLRGLQIDKKLNALQADNNYFNEVSKRYATNSTIVNDVFRDIKSA